MKGSRTESGLIVCGRVYFITRKMVVQKHGDRNSQMKYFLTDWALRTTWLFGNYVSPFLGTLPLCYSIVTRTMSLNENTGCTYRTHLIKFRFSNFRFPVPYSQCPARSKHGVRKSLATMKIGGFLGFCVAHDVSEQYSYVEWSDGWLCGSSAYAGKL